MHCLYVCNDKLNFFCNIVEMEYESPIPSPIREPSPLPESPKPKEVKTDSPKKESPEKVTYNETGEKKRRRRRKLVPKTFMDDEGYMGKYVKLTKTFILFKEYRFWCISCFISEIKSLTKMQILIELKVL